MMQHTRLYFDVRLHLHNALDDRCFVFSQMKAGGVSTRADQLDDMIKDTKARKLACIVCSSRCVLVILLSSQSSLFRS